MFLQTFATFSTKKRRILKMAITLKHILALVDRLLDIKGIVLHLNKN